MAKQTVGLGSSANDGTGDTLRSGGTKINANFNEIYAEFGDGTDLSNANTSGDILVADGTKFVNRTTSGDINITNTGAINLRGNELSIIAGSAPGTTTNKLYNVGSTLYWNGTAVGVAGGSAISGFNVSGDTGTDAVGDGETIEYTGGTGLTSAVTDESGTPTVTFNIDATVATLTGTQTFTNKTLTSPVFNTGVSGSAILDSDTMSGASATTLSSSESIKAYVDAQVASENTIDEMNDTTISSAADGHFLVHTGTAWVNEAPATARTSLGLGTIATVAAPAGTVVGTTDTQTLSAKTLTEPKIVDGGFIADANGAEQIIFQTTASAVNEIEVTNSATGGSAVASTSTAPIIGASGETNVDLALLPKGTGITTVRSTGGANNQGMIRLNCENNTHGQTVMSQPHSAADSSYFMLPKGSSAGNARATPDVLLSGDKTVGTSETVTSSGAVSVDTLVTLLNSSGGAVALTLAAGVVGQIKIISMITAGNAATMTIANGNLAGMSTSIVWDAVGEGVTLMYNGAKWVVVGNYGASIT